MDDSKTDITWHQMKMNILMIIMKIDRLSETMNKMDSNGLFFFLWKEIWQWQKQIIQIWILYVWTNQTEYCVHAFYYLYSIFNKDQRQIKYFAFWINKINKSPISPILKNVDYSTKLLRDWSKQLVATKITGDFAQARIMCRKMPARSGASSYLAIKRSLGQAVKNVNFHFHGPWTGKPPTTDSWYVSNRWLMRAFNGSLLSIICPCEKGKKIPRLK